MVDPLFHCSWVKWEIFTYCSKASCDPNVAENGIYVKIVKWINYTLSLFINIKNF